MNKTKTMIKLKNTVFLLFLSGAILTSCEKDDNVAPPEENEVEVITDFKLIFTNVADPTDVVEAAAKDPDGEGVEELQILNPIHLEANTTYELSFTIENNLESPGEDIAEEILEEDDEHQFFFAFSDNAFSNPNGNGNIDNSSDPINYNDTDGNGNPLGLSTTWTTSDTTTNNGIFNVRLQHQPDIKTATSGANDGDTDVDLSFELHIN